MMIIYIDIILLVILLVLTLSTCGYCFFRIHRMRQNGQVAILLQPRKVLFSHRKEGRSNDELRTVVAYQNPFTGDYCVHRSPQPRGYENQLLSPASTDSGLSDAYEPLHLEPRHPVPRHLEPRQPELRHPEPKLFEPWQPKPRHSEPRHPELRHLEPRNPEPRDLEPKHIQPWNFEPPHVEPVHQTRYPEKAQPPQESGDYNSLDKSWNWTYKEYQI